MVFVEVAKKTSRTWDVTAGMLAAVLLAIAPGTAYAQCRGPAGPNRRRHRPRRGGAGVADRPYPGAHRGKPCLPHRRQDDRAPGRCGRRSSNQATLSPNSTRSRSRTPCVPRRPQHAAAQASLHEAANNLERQRTLVAQGWSTRVQFDATEKTFLSAKAEVDATAAQLHAAEDQLGYTKLLADSSGAGDRHRRRGRRGRAGPAR